MVGGEKSAGPHIPKPGPESWLDRFGQFLAVGWSRNRRAISHTRRLTPKRYAARCSRATSFSWKAISAFRQP